MSFIVLLWTAPEGQAHPMGNFSINHHTTIEASDREITIHYILDFAEIPTYQMFPTGAASAVPAEDWAEGLQLQVDGAVVPLMLRGVSSSRRAGAGGLSTFRVEMNLAAAWTLSAAQLRFEDHNFPNRIGWKEIVVRDGASAVFADADNLKSDRSLGLTRYPSDLLASAPDLVDVTVNVKPGAGSSAGGGFAGRLLNSDKQDHLATILTSSQLSPRLLLIGMVIAFVLGGMHALSPGHGKTVVAAYLVGNRGTARHALFLGAVVTITHTAGVFVLGLITLFLSRYVVPERLYPWLTLSSGVMIVVIGINLFVRRFRTIVHDHSHEIPASLSFRSLIVLGMSGGIVPCPSALVVLLSAVALHRIGAGLAFILAFSFGLAAVLIAIGVLVVRAGRWLARWDGGHSLSGPLSITSAAIVTVIGAAVAWSALPATGLVSGTIEIGGGALMVLSLGLLLGLKHATDADHVVAVTTFVSEERSLWRSCWIGAFWGMGHTLSLAIAGLLVIVFRIQLSGWLASRLELLVAVMLVALGARLVIQAARGKKRVHVHSHVHAVSGSEPAKHSHWQLHNLFGSHIHADWQHVGLRPVLVGMIHGAAGSAALMLLVLSTIRSPLEAFLYILIFGFGSIAGMLLISFLLALPLRWARGRMAMRYQSIQLLAGAFSCVFGLYLGAQLWLSLP